MINSTLSTSYWTGNGKYQELADKLSTLKCDFGFTSNKYIDAFIVMSKIYHDVYNNGWGGNNEALHERLNNYVRPVMGSRFGNMRRFYSDLQYLEDMMNKVIVFIADKDLDYYRYVVFIDNERRWYSVTNHFQGSSRYVFGDKRVFEKLISGYKRV